jgi:6-phosphofructokinase 1
MTGAFAVKAAFAGKTGEMVVMKCNRDGGYSCEADSYDINQIANEIKFVPQEWICDNGTNNTDDFINYARPLIFGEPNLIFENGLPKHIVK